MILEHGVIASKSAKQIGKHRSIDWWIASFCGEKTRL